MIESKYAGKSFLTSSLIIIFNIAIEKIIHRRFTQNQWAQRTIPRAIGMFLID